MTLSKHVFGAVLALSVIGCADATGFEDSEPQSEHAAQLAVSSTVDVPVTLRGSAKATLKASVYVNPNATGVATILSVPGFTATGKVYENLNAALFADTVTGPLTKQAITLDLPGHGASTKPTGIKYGDLTIEDNAEALVQSVQQLKPQLLVGYGSGALTIAVAQEQLLKSGSSLAKLGVTSALLYAPVPSAGRPWTTPPTPATISNFISTNDVDGAIYTITPDLWNRQGFTNKAGTGGIGAPTAAEVTAKGLLAVEPVALVSQLTGITDPSKGAVVPRPTVSAGAFAAANGTRLIVLGFSEATQVTSADAADFYVHLTGDASKAGFVEVTGADAVGNAFYTNPKAVLAATTKFFAR